MIRDEELMDKLVADLHFHNYMGVNVGDNIFTDRNEGIEMIQDYIDNLGLGNRLNANVDFYHGGKVIGPSKQNHIEEYIDDVYIDYFFRSYDFDPIIFPKGFCYQRITANGIKHPTEDVSLNLGDQYDRCTFCNNMFRLFFVDKALLELFPNNKFIKQFYAKQEVYGVHAGSYVLSNEIPYEKEWNSYLDEYYYPKGVIAPQFRAREIIKYIDYLRQRGSSNLYEGMPDSYMMKVSNFDRGFLNIKDCHIFGSYSIEDLFFIYGLLVDKFYLDGESFTLCVCHLSSYSQNVNLLLKAFEEFENRVNDYKMIEPFIKSKDLYLRFTSPNKSKAVKFEPKNDVTKTVRFFEGEAVDLVFYGNTLPLPYLYNDLNNTELCL